LDLDGKSALDLAITGNHNEIISLLRSWPVNAIDASANNNDETDLYRVAEKQLRGIRTMQQLRSMLQKNCGLPKKSSSIITRVLGCRVDCNDDEQDLQCTTSLAEEHGAVIFRNFVPRRVDQLALAALALRPLNLDYSNVTDELSKCCAHNGSNEHPSKSQRKQQRKQIEKMKSQLTTPSDASIICQTNWGPQMQSYAQKGPEESESALKRRKIDSFPLSKLRYLNLGAFNYNWGDRRYDLISGATALHSRLVNLAQHATTMAIQKGDVSHKDLTIDFNMAICNFYHLQRPSDRLGGHQDNVESNLSLPLVTISLGAPGVFLLGRESREELPTAILLKAGDCMVLSGKSRGYFHGIPTILEYDDDNDDISHESEENLLFPELSDEGLLVNNKGDAASEDDLGYVPTQVELKFAEAFLSTVRMNMSIRQV
jgi:DNA alkylation damage repair protein AlkB